MREGQRMLSAPGKSFSSRYSARPSTRRCPRSKRSRGAVRFLPYPLDAANKTAHVEQNPEPFVLQKSLDDFTVSYEINAYTRRPDLLPAIYSELNRNILDEFSREKIEIMSPTYTSVRDGNPLAVPEPEG